VSQINGDNDTKYLYEIKAVKFYKFFSCVAYAFENLDFNNTDFSIHTEFDFEVNLRGASRTRTLFYVLF